MANGDNALGGDLSVSPDLAPGSVANQLMFGPRGQAPAAAAPARPHFDLALGDSIAAQQYHHGIGGLATPRMYSANPDPIDWNSNKYTAEVGAPPTRILARVKDMLAKDPDALRGKNVFLGIGSNQPDVEGQFDAIPEVLKTLQEAGVGHVTVPSLGPGVPNSAALNIQLGSMVKGAGDNFTFFSPNIKWQKDGVHPANGQDMQNEALKAVQQAEGGSGEASRTVSAPSPTPVVAPPAAGAPTPLVPPGSLYTPPSPLQAPAGSGYTLGPMLLPGSEPGMRLPGMPPAPGAAPVDTDAGKFVNWQGMRIPMADAKRMIRMTEPGAQGYNAAFGSHSGLPSGYQTDQNGFPIWSGNPVGSMYGGAFEGKLSHAAGMYQFEPDTWASAVGALRDQGVNINDFSQGSQEAVASHLLEQSGFGPWAPWNPNLRAMLAQYKQTGQVPTGTDPGEGAVATSAVGPYRSGDVVPGTGMAVGGQLSGFVPYVPNQLAPGPQVASAGGTDATTSDGSTTGGSGGWTPDPSKFTQPGGLAGQGSLLDDPKYRQALMFQILGAQMQGIKFHPSTYNPQAGNQQLPVGEPIRFLAGPMTIRPNETFGSAALRGAWYE